MKLSPSPKGVILVQARMGSTRLPGKVLLPVLGKSLLYRMIERLRFSKYHHIWVITTREPEDELIIKECESIGVPTLKGHPTDLLDRHYQAALATQAEWIVKIPSDCPLIDPQIINKVIDYFLDNFPAFDYVSNLHPATYPDGNDVEIMTFSTLETAWKNATRNFEREHTTPYIWENPNKFRIGNVTWETGKNYSMTHRFTLDYPEDYEFIKAVYERLYPLCPNFSLQDVLTLLEKEPSLYQINKKYCGVNWYRHHLHELKTISAQETKLDFM
ncbi:MAG: glycosyltransferase family protein [Bacteroidia bacterium]|nr:glycosyltransferase family protein [Bacteroidia bacterium]